MAGPDYPSSTGALQDSCRPIGKARLSMWHPFGPIDDPTALALGRFVWATISLEGIINRVCEAIHGSLKEAVSDNIKDAIEHANATQDPYELAAAKWLKRARSATYYRNQILHSTKAGFMTDDGASLAEFPDDIDVQLAVALAARATGEAASDV